MKSLNLVTNGRNLYKTIIKKLALYIQSLPVIDTYIRYDVY